MRCSIALTHYSHAWFYSDVLSLIQTVLKFDGVHNAIEGSVINSQFSCNRSQYLFSDDGGDAIS
jgi:hypothetical protein